MGELFRAMGNGAEALAYFEKALAVSERLSVGTPENADYARGLCVVCTRMAMIAEDGSDQAEAMIWWGKAYQILAGMKRRGMFLSPEDERCLEQLAAKVG